MKHAGTDSPILISAAVEPGGIRVSVADRGPGLPPVPVEQLFQRFYKPRGHGAGDGVGLGLAICRAIVESHGGRIEASNRPDGGAVFSFFLPTTIPVPTVAGEDTDESGDEP